MAYLDMLRDGDVSTALPCTPPDVDQVALSLSTGAETAYASATGIAKVTLMTNEIVMAN